MTRRCEACNESCPIDANWCEACGADLDATNTPPKVPCISCGAAAVEVTDDGWCQICGTKQPAPGDHVVADHGWFAIVSDRGRVHRTNEDAGAVAARSAGVAIVVCDGVSSTDDAHHAAQAAAAAIVDRIETAPAEKFEQRLISATRDAQTEIISLTPSSANEPPSCTMVAAVADIHGSTATVRFGWLGDSRAYWVANGSAVQLTTDHALGSSITRWLGADSPDVTPEMSSAEVDLPGVLLVCSDGLWNYAPTTEEMHRLVAPGSHTNMLEHAERLVAFANEQGGHDNITVAVAALNPQART